MSTKMEENFRKAMIPQNTISGSVDALRDSVKDLYTLDEDNYQRILVSEQGYSLLKSKVDVLEADQKKLLGKVRRINGKRVLGFMLLGAAMYGITKAVDRIEKKINDRLDALENRKERDESDG